MHLYDINPKYRRTVVNEIARLGFRGPWEIMSFEPGSTREQLWVGETNDALKLRLTIRWDALTPYRETMQ